MSKPPSIYEIIKALKARDVIRYWANGKEYDIQAIPPPEWKPTGLYFVSVGPKGTGYWSQGDSSFWASESDLRGMYLQGLDRPRIERQSVG